MPLIAADNFFGLGAVLFGLASLGFWIDRLALGRRTSGVLWVLVTGMALSHFGVVPYSAPTFDFVGGNVVSLAIPLLLFKADLRRIVRESGRVIVTFGVASIATVVGALLGYYLTDLGEAGAQAAGMFAAGFIGGSMNFLAVAQIVEMDKVEFAAALSGSTVASIIALLLLITIPSIRWIARFLPPRASRPADVAELPAEHAAEPPRVRLLHITGAMALSFAICTLSAAVASLLGHPSYAILYVTIFTILVANLAPRLMQKLEGEFEIGMILMYVFFAMVGCTTSYAQFAGPAAIYFLFAMIVIVTHIVIVLGMARLLKVDLPEAIVASGAALMGPAVTAAIAISQGWRSLVTPAVMTGVLGYVIGTFIGVALAGFLAH